MLAYSTIKKKEKKKKKEIMPTEDFNFVNMTFKTLFSNTFLVTISVTIESL